MSWRFFVDRGGTFTDVVAIPPQGPRRVRKLLSECPEHYEDAALQAIQELYADDPAGIAAVKMGTTVATNALLERRGERTLLVITRGFADALQIGDQTRPDLFARAISLPTPLYEQVLEVDERMDARGGLLQAPDPDTVRAGLQRFYDEGFRAVAVVCLHSYQNPAHEQLIGAEAAAVGFEQISLSHEVSALMKLVGRGNTTVVDAYLSPVLRRYVDRVARALPDVPLSFMQSHGGLTPAANFRGKDSILSGPAGGIIGAIETCRAAGFERIIAFDMGGTSTDVSHYAGTLERRFETEVAGVRLRAPMMAIHTVAAGGGSLLSYDGSQLRVGPESAGANPGPACYRRGGPPTITDCNLVLGRIQPDAFPAVFGPEGDQPLDMEAARAALANLAARLERSPEQVAEDFLNVAVETMARAIKRISIDRGHDLTRYALCAFGGAGGQHACRVADALGIPTVVIHPDAGVLSAWGMGLAAQRTLREQSVEIPLSDGLASIEPVFSDLSRELEGSICRRVHVRYTGSDQSLTVPYGSVAEITEAFGTLHRQRYGFLPPERPLIIAMVSVEAMVQDPCVQPNVPPPTNTHTAPASKTVHMFAGGKAHAAPIFERSQLPAHTQIQGPAILTEATGTTVIEIGWEAEVRPTGHLVLERREQRARDASTLRVDPMRLALFNHRFMSIAEQMGITLEHTSQSVNIKERRDYSCALFDHEGRLVANAPHIPVHLGSMGDSVRAVRDARGAELAPGDAYVLNDPYGGGTHLPDITVVSPVFCGTTGPPDFFVASRGHHADVGGLTPGSMPPSSTTLSEEGLLIQNFQAVVRGRFQEEATRALFSTARNPGQNLADLHAQIAANERGSQELHRLIEEQGLDVVSAYMGHVRAHAEEAVRRVLETLPDGHFQCTMDDGCHIEVRITVDQSARRARVDFSGTSAQQPTNINAPQAVCKAAVLYVFRLITGSDIPLNEGCLAPLDIVIPAGSMLAPEAPAAVVAGNVETSQILCDALLGALGAMAGSQGTMNNLTFGNDTHQYYETICGGAGAGPGFSGASHVHTHMTNSRLTDPEVLEWRYPVRVESFGVRHGSGGAGEFCGGDGVTRRIRFNEAMTVSILSNRRRTAPHGLCGGSDGAPGQNAIERADGRTEPLAHRATADVLPGDRLQIDTPGGGGYGAAPTR